jgi:hypothetical protein
MSEEVAWRGSIGVDTTSVTRSTKVGRKRSLAEREDRLTVSDMHGDEAWDEVIA